MTGPADLDPEAGEAWPRLPPEPRLRSKESTRATSVCSDLENSEQKNYVSVYEV